MSSILYSCVDPYALQTDTFEDAIVIEATITNELKFQEIKISRTYRFEDVIPTFETGATVYITDELNNEFNFHEDGNKYISDNEFKALPNKTYQLHIITANGREYISTTQTLTTESNIESLNTSVITNQQGEKGVQINVNSYDPSNTSKYYRYEYEETYKVIAPKWVSNDIVYNATSDSFILTERDLNKKTCYSFEKSNQIIQTNTNNLLEDRVTNFPVRFISNQNYIIANRYTILVKQYVQNLSAYNYYKTLSEMSSEGSILSPNQPGFLFGNLKSLTNPNEKVIGFFEVASVSSSRIFFNYVDLFPTDPTPSFFNECNSIEFDISLVGDNPGSSPKARLINGLSLNTIVFYELTYPTYFMVPTFCGDCTSFSSNIIPSYWTD